MKTSWSSHGLDIKTTTGLSLYGAIVFCGIVRVVVLERGHWKNILTLFNWKYFAMLFLCLGLALTARFTNTNCYTMVHTAWHLFGFLALAFGYKSKNEDVKLSNSTEDEGLYFSGKGYHIVDDNPSSGELVELGK